MTSPDVADILTLRTMGSDKDRSDDAHRYADAEPRESDPGLECLLADLHDGLGQELAAISLILQANVKNPPSTRAALARELSHLSELVQQALRTLRDLTSGSMEFENFSLVEALRRLTRTLSRTPGLSVRFSARDVHAIPGPTASQLYRIAQEALANAMKHSRARHVRIELVATKRRIRLSVIDDGRGIGPSRRGGCGLRSMRFRAAAIGGVLNIEAGTEAGTVVTCTCPSASSITPATR